MSQQPAPPKPGPKPGQVKVVRATYKYTAQYPDELSFEEGDILYIQDSESDPDWWKGTCKGRTGLVPSNYVEDNAEVIENPVHDAAKRGNLSFLKECLANKVAVNATDKSGSTALYCAAHAGHLPCVMELLLCPVVQLNIQNKLGDTALHAAAWKGHAEIVSALLLKGALLDQKNLDGKTPLDLANDSQVRDLLQKASGLSVSNAGANEYFGDDDDADSD